MLMVVLLAVLAYASHRTGSTWSQTLRSVFLPSGDGPTDSQKVDPTVASDAAPTNFLRAVTIGDPFEKPPRISNVLAVDLDQDGLLDVVVCDARANRVTWIRQHSAGTFQEHILAAGLVAPCHTHASDFDGDGDLDLLVAVLGNMMPSNEKVGSVVILENQGDMKFEKRVISKNLPRVADVRAGDIDGDGDLDLVATAFGQLEGKTWWMENLGEWNFKSHTLQTLSEGIHSELADIDDDGDLDIVLLVSQEWEEIYLFRNDGRGTFTPSVIYGSSNDDFGSSGIHLCDFDRDGDVDVVYTNGDCFDYVPPRTRTWHGVQWLENQGNGVFEFHRIIDFRAAFRALQSDVDRDGDLDLFVANGFSSTPNSDTQSLIWLENDGQMRFRRHDLADSPGNLITMDLGDFDGDGVTDLVTHG